MTPSNDPDGDGSDGSDTPRDPDGPGEADGPDGADGPGEADGSVRRLQRRTLIRLLVGLGIGIPIAIEAATFLGLVGQRFGFGDGEGEDGTTAGTETPARPPVGVGDELLPETQPTDRLTGAVVYATADRWRVELAVEVENRLDTAYELRLGDLTTDGGKTVAGGGTTGTMASGTTTTVTGTWEVPSGATPESVSVTALVAVPGADEQRRHSRRVPLEKVPVRGV